MFSIQRASMIATMAFGLMSCAAEGLGQTVGDRGGATCPGAGCPLVVGKRRSRDDLEEAAARTAGPR